MFMIPVHSCDESSWPLAGTMLLAYAIAFLLFYFIARPLIDWYYGRDRK